MICNNLFKNEPQQIPKVYLISSLHRSFPSSFLPSFFLSFFFEDHIAAELLLPKLTDLDVSHLMDGESKCLQCKPLNTFP